ncbi:MAG TPA: carboxypeptidase-like regulatory domain-containing protein, partial [Trueperaceae bacterium]
TPIEGAVVNVYDQEGALLSSTVSEADGSFSFITLLQGRYDLEFSAEGFEAARAEDVAVTPGETTDLGEIALAPSAATP